MSPFVILGVSCLFCGFYFVFDGKKIVLANIVDPDQTPHVDKTRFHMVKGIISAFDHMEFCLALNLTMGGNPAVTWPPIIANVSFATTLNTR